ncbi:MAG: DUF1513 domain-containing protein [Gammaproteobacteria bacterium]|nr:DUF1513 domain-containing protein [Gammaproteobacteria bacterium]MCP5137072.1 DUF1513 domain-containing protein [Gammaproteobacteria bacterium]
MQRRDFLKLAALGLLAPGTTLTLPARALSHDVRLLSAASDGDGHHFVIGLTADGEPRFRTPLPTRAHAVVAHPDGRHALAVSRRPGRVITVVALDDGRVTHSIEAPEGRHFYGHAVFSPDRKRLFATENAFGDGGGRIGVYAVDDGYRRLSEWDSGGIGPHELLMRPDNTLVVANGGLRTHPDEGRRTLNPDHIEPSIVWLDASGNLLARHQTAPEWRRSSIRHIAALRGGHIAIAMQFQGDSRGEAPLVAIAHPRDGLRTLNVPDALQRRLRDYCGSVTAARDGGSFAVSAPRGNRILFWRADGEYLGATRVEDGCGLAAGATAGEFLISDGLGGLRRHDALTGTQTPLSPSALRFDNHLSSIVPPL